MRITVASTFAVSPPRCGASLRYFHLYRHVARRHEVEIVSLVKPDAGALEAEIAPGLREVRIPVSPAHQGAEMEMSARVSGFPVSDISAARLYRLTPAYLEALRASCARADLVIASHPYLIHALREVSRRPLVYEAPDVELDLKTAALPSGAGAVDLLSLVERVEAECCREARLVLACSEADRARFIDRYALEPERVRLAPNGADVEGIAYDGWDERCSRRAGACTALFLASWHPPNNDAARRVLAMAQALPSVRFVVAGSVGAAVAGGRLPANVVVTGAIDEATKLAVLREADVALNPVTAGAGSNVKMLEYCAAGLPVVSTAFGTRGIGLEDGAHVLIREVEAFPAAIQEVCARESRAIVGARVEAAYRYVAERCDWARIGSGVATLLEGAIAAAPSGRTPDLVSVVVPMLNAAPFIEECVESALVQTYPHLEVIVVDDGCDDASPSIVQRLAARDRRVRLLRHPEGRNRGVSRSIELALSHARGRRVALLDADDVFEPAKLATQAALMDAHPDAVVCHSQVGVIGDTTSELATKADAYFNVFDRVEQYGLFDRVDIFEVCPLVTSAALIDAAALRSVPFAAPQWFQSEDWLLFALLATRGPFVCTPEKLTRYRVHAAAYTTKVLTHDIGNFYAQIELLLTLRTRLDDPVLIARADDQLRSMLRYGADLYADPTARLSVHRDVGALGRGADHGVSLRWAAGTPSPGRVLHVEVEVTNRGSHVLASLPPHPVHLCYHWVDPRTQTYVVWDGERTRLEPPLAPGQSHVYRVTVELPEYEQRLLLQVGLVQEGGAWFSSHADVVVDTTRPSPRLATASRLARGIKRRLGAAGRW